MTGIEGEFGFATMRWSDWQTLVAHMRNLLSDATSYRDETKLLRAENAALKARVNDLVSIVKEQRTALEERDAIIAEYEAQRREMLADVATISAALQKASDAYVNSHELAKQNDALGADAPGNGIKVAAIIDGMRALLALGEKTGIPRQSLLYLLSFCIKFAEMPEGKSDEFMANFTGGHDNRDAKKAGGRTRSVSETMLTAQVAAFYAALKENGLPPAEAMRVLAKACGLTQEQQRKIRDICTRVAGSKDPSIKRFYREAEKMIGEMAIKGLPPEQAVTGFLRELFEQDPTLLTYIQKSKS